MGDAYVFGELHWPMPDPGLIAVWRAMSIDASRWTDWDGFVDGRPAGTIGALVDQVEVFQLEIDERGVKLRAYVDGSRADWGQRLAVAWRLAADLDARGEFAWVPRMTGLAYRGVIADGNSRWEKLTGIAAKVIEALPGRREIDKLVARRGSPLAATQTLQAARPAARPATKRAATKPGKAKPKPPGTKATPNKKKPAARRR